VIDIRPAQREQLAAPKSRQHREPCHRPPQRRQRLEQLCRLLTREHPFRPNGSKRRQIHAASRIVLQVAPFDGRAKQRA
jgi:hypothetical protein